VARRVSAVVDRLLGEGRVVSRKDGSVHELAPVAVGRAEGEALAEMVLRERAQRVLEVGLGYAISTLFMCDALLELGPPAQLVAVDPQQATRFSNCGLQVLEEAGVANLVELHEEESQILLPRFVEEGREFDFAFVDGDHRFDGVFLDLVYLGRLVRRGGTVVVDDYQLPAVVRAVSFFVTNLRWSIEETSAIDPDHNWAVLRTAHEPDDRAWDYFVDF
jgi:predicted O-methyltransferase YrrM